MPEISIKAERIFDIFGYHVTNSVFLSLVVFVFLIIVAVAYKKETMSSKKSKFYYFLQLILRNIYNLFESTLKEKVSFFFPFLAALFLWIVFQNWFGLLPGVGSITIGIAEGEHLLHVPLFRGNNADLNGTLALAIWAIIVVQFAGIKFLGFKTYAQKFINVSNPINFFLGFLEIISEFSKIMSFSFRLFGNIFAGEVLLTIVAFLVPAFASFPFLMLEIFVGFVQALVFSLLTSVFISVSVAHH